MKRYVTRIPNSDHYIYKIGFGTYDLIDSGLSREAMKELLNDFVSMGGNVIDTARVDIGSRGSNVEDSQKIVGEWLHESGRRDLVCLIGKSNALLNKESKDKIKTIGDDLDKTLKNLHTNYVDVFLIDGDDEITPVSDIIKKFEKLKDENRIKNYGCSNWKPFRIREAMEYAKENGFEGFTINQMLWNIGSKNMNPFKDHDNYSKMNEEMMSIHKQYYILAMPYNALANGFFAKLYMNEVEKGSVDIENIKETSPYYTKANLEVYKKIKTIGEKYIASPGWVAMGYLFNQKINTCSIFSSKNLSKMKEIFEAIDKNYTYEDFKDIYEKDIEESYVTLT